MGGQRREWAMILCAGALAVASCRRAPTGLRVIVTTNFEPASTSPQLHTVRLRVTRLSDGRVLHSEGVRVLSATTALPLKFNVFLAGNGGEQVRIEAEAHTVDTHTDDSHRGLTAARVVTGFVEGQIRVVPMVLYRGCWDRRVQCDPDSTCGPTASCTSAQVDQRELPTFTSDAGDPDVIVPGEMDGGTDASTDGSEESGIDSGVDSGIDARSDVTDARFEDVRAEGTLDSGSDVSSGDAGCPMPRVLTIPMSRAVPHRFAMTTIPLSGDGGMMPGSAVEVVFERTSAPMMLALADARMARDASGEWTVARGAASAHSISGQRLLGLDIKQGRNLTEMFALVEQPESMSERRYVVVGSRVGDMLGIGAPVGQTPTTTLGQLPMRPSWDVAFGASGDDPMRLDAVTCMRETSGSLFCQARSSMSGTVRGFTVNLPPGRTTNYRLVALEASSTEARFVLEASDGLDYALCSVGVPGADGAVVGAVCNVVESMDPIVPGSMYAQWIEGFNCGGMMMAAGWYGSLLRIESGTRRLRAGRLPTSGMLSLPISVDELSAAATTAFSIAPAACEMLVAVKGGAEIRYRRRLLSGMPSTREPFRVTTANDVSAIRAVPFAPPVPSMPGTDEHIHGFVDGSENVNVVFVPTCM